ncbi:MULTISPECIES: phosphotransferase [unclassified Brevibacillus]|uniref:phosphotransferase n=1 Tax=unclassified Brevibacillus TaxID=2684853 RepID=UPI003568EB35
MTKLFQLNSEDDMEKVGPSRSKSHKRRCKNTTVLYQLAADKILTGLSKLDKNSSNYGIIHGDLHQGNIVFHNGDPRPIDFGRCGFGYYLYDIAHTILGLFPA